ncbi:MAG: aa3-type cytochrome oxidase subunit CtaJ [Haloechinothrix sp.]
MSVVETILIFVAIPLALYGLVSLLTLRSRFVNTPRYRPGQDWKYPAVWWGANPAGVGSAHGHAVSGSDGRPQAASVRGGARGSW